MAEDARYTPEYKLLYEQRKEKIERVFADAKEKHGMRYTQLRGLTQVNNWVKLKFAARNLKKLANWKWQKRYPLPDCSFSSLLLAFFFSLFPFPNKRPFIAFV